MQERIGEIAGFIWDFLEDQGEASVTAVVDAIEAPSTKVYMGLGWLAEEGEIKFEEKGRGSYVRLS